MSLTAETVREWYAPLSDDQIAERLTQELMQLRVWLRRSHDVLEATHSSRRIANEQRNAQRLTLEIAAWEQRLALLRETACTE